MSALFLLPDDVVLVADPVAAEHVAALPRDGERLAAVVPLQDGDHLGDELALLLEAAQLQAGVQAQADLRHRVRQLLLDQLIGAERAAELLPVQDVVPRLLHAELRRAEAAPRDAVARVVEAGEGSAEALHVGEHVLLGHDHVVHEDHPGHGGAQGELALNLGSRESLHPLLENEAAEAALGLRPDDEHVSNGGIGDPVLDRGIQMTFILEVSLHYFNLHDNNKMMFM